MPRVAQRSRTAAKQTVLNRWVQVGQGLRAIPQRPQHWRGIAPAHRLYGRCCDIQISQQTLSPQEGGHLAHGDCATLQTFE